ncbi:PaaI family thioesterase [Candidatus Solincola sp.]|jgi:acyl-CoA thioesterase|nr:PaaI family thioesterase [Actinomycetota bacterium]MDI7252511.1 PaaI family thioesterase [Actinomycetota bacterium]
MHEEKQLTADTVQPEIREIIESDSYARHLGARVVEIRPGYAKVEMELGPQHLNFMGMIHGGVIFGLADVGFGAAANSFGSRAMALSVGIDFLAAPHVQGVMTAEVELVARAGKMGHYRMEVTDAGGTVVAQCKGWAYHTGRPLDAEKEGDSTGSGSDGQQLLP